MMIERKIALRGYRKYRKTIWETDSRVEYFFQRSTSATDGKDIRLYRMEKWFVDVMKMLVQRRMKVWKRVEMYYFLPHLSDTIWSFVRDIIAYTVLVNQFLAGELNATTFTFYLVDQIINNWLHFTKRLLMKFHQAYTSNDRLPDQHLLHQNIYKFCPQVPALC